LLLRRKPEILKDRDLAGELKDVWTAVQNFRDKEKAFSSGGQDIVVYTEFGPDSGHRNETNNGKPVKSEIHEASKVDQQQLDTQNHVEKDNGDVENVVEKEKCDEVVTPDDSEAPSIEIDKLSIGGSDKKVSSKNNENHHTNESSEKIVKIQNQKNKESQHHFFPKFLSSSKEKEAKDKDKEKPQPDEAEPKSKTKKSFFSLKRNKSQSSPTHTSNNKDSSNQKGDSEH
jgi:hypothetical protein